MMTQEEILKLVTELYNIPESEERIEDVVRQLRRVFPQSHINDLIHWNPVDLTPEQIVAEAFCRDAEYRRQNGEQPTADR